MILLTQQVGVDIKIDYMCNIIEDMQSSTILITATIMDFSLIAGVWNVYPRNFLPSGDVVNEKKKEKFCCTPKSIQNHTQL